MNMTRRQSMIGASCFIAACTSARPNEPYLSDIYEVFHTDFWELLIPSEGFDILGSGYGWAEGPAWDPESSSLFFTDVPGNIAYRWNKDSGVKPFLNPSGSSTTEGFREAGANGLLKGKNNQILLCNHGERAIQSLDLDTKKRTNLASSFEGKKFNSPNDLIQSNDGSIYFTDPPYGLEGLNKSPLKEQSVNGVYKMNPDGQVSLLIKDMSFPNGIALSPDEQFLYISQSDPDSPILFRVDLKKDIVIKETWVDFSIYATPDFTGLPDGMVVDTQGNIFVTGPGGVFVINSEGKILGRILTGKASANCTFGEDGSTLFITNHDRLIKLRTRTKGLGIV